MNDSIHDRIAEMQYEAKALGIPCVRLYLGEVKMRELEAWLATQTMIRDSSCSEFTFRGMKVVRSSKPGMAIGR